MTSTTDILLDTFKERELEILTLMAAGYSNLEIAGKLFITKETVRWYNKQIYSKIGTSRRTEAIAKAQRLGLIQSETQATHPAATTKTDHLPTISAPFIGRHNDLQAVSQLLQRPHTPIVTLTGSGGAGKTRLAIELGHQVATQFPDGLYFIELASLNHVDQLAAAALKALHIPLAPNKTAQQILFDVCRDKKMLIIFDNFEELLDGAILLHQLIQAAPGLRLLVTSRERLNLSNETVYPLAGLGQSADELFIAQASMVKPDFALQQDDHLAVSKIAGLVGGLPLAILMAASWIDILSVTEIAADLEHDLDMLATEMRDIPKRQQSIRAILESSWHKLTPIEQETCAQLSLLPSSFSRAAARAIAQTNVRVMQQLQHKSLLQLTEAKRYTIHPLVRQFAREKLRESNQTTPTQKRTLHYYQQFVASNQQALKQGDVTHALNQIQLEHDNIRQSLDWGGQQVEETYSTIQLTQEMYTYWDHRSYPQEIIRYFRQALALADHTDKTIISGLLSKRSRALIRLGQLEEAEYDLRQALNHATNRDDVQLQLECLGGLNPHP